MRREEPIETVPGDVRSVQQETSRSTLTRVNGRQLSLRVQIEDVWLSVLTEIDVSIRKPVALLEWNRIWPGPARLGWAGAPGCVQLLSELYLNSARDVGGSEKATFLDLTADDFQAAWQSLETGRDPEIGATEGVEELDRSELVDGCTNAGWKINEQADGPLRIELADPSGFYQAEYLGEGSGTRFSVPIASAQTPSEESLNAIALTLLRTGAMTRLLRPAIERSTDSIVALLEVRLGSNPSAEALDDSLSALSLAVRLCGREVQALADPVLARTYLEIAGWYSMPADHHRRIDQ